ncbi:putative glycosyltransferase [Chloropicon primus]|nr:putative glycosyltransferase [Chloropicon primus]
MARRFLVFLLGLLGSICVGQGGRGATGAGAGRHGGVQSVLVVCDLYPYGSPIFDELEETWLHLARHLGRQGHNVTLVPIADAAVDYAGKYVVSSLDAKVKALKLVVDEEDNGDDDLNSEVISANLIDTPVFHNFATPSRTIHNAYTLYTFLKQRCRTENAGRAPPGGECDFDAVYFTDWGGLAYYCLLAKEQGLFFQDVSFIEVRSVGTRLQHAGLRGVVPTTDLLGSIDDLQTAHMEIESSQRATGVLYPSDFVAPARFKGAAEAKAKAKGSLDVEIVFVGSLTQADGIDMFTSAVEKLCKHIVAEKAERRLRVTFLGRKLYFSGESAPSRRKQLSRSKVENYFDEWVAWAGSEFKEVLSLNHHNVGLQQQVGYFKQNPGAVAVLCNTDLKQNFVLNVLMLNDVNVLAPAANPGAGDQCHFKPTSSGLHRALTKMVHGSLPGPQCLRGHGNSTLGFVPDSAAPKSREPSVPAGGSGGAPREVEGRGEILVTCVVTHYNRGSFLLQALASLLEQTHKKLEIIVVDDGSTDESSIDVLDSLDRKYSESCGNDDGEGPCVKVVRIENSYLGGARNVGLRMAQGDFVLFMDDDNYAKPYEVSTFLQAMQDTKSDIAACASEYLASSLDPQVAFNRSLHRQERSGPKVHIPLGPSVASGLFSNVYGDANLMLRKATCATFSWPEDDSYAVQDWEVLARESARNLRKVTLIPEPLFYYRTTSTSMAQTASLSRISKHSDQLYMRAFMEELPLNLGPLVPYAVDLKLQLEEVRKERKELERKRKMLTAVLKPLVVEHCKYQKRFNADPFSKNLLMNSNFMEWNQLEAYQRTGQLARRWNRYETGYAFTPEGIVESNISSPACLVKLDNIGKVAGAMQEVVLMQKEPKPLLLHGWSKALNVSGAGQPADYSLYADITFRDWTHAWGEYCPFDQDKEGWQESFGVIDFDKPIHSVVVVLMFRWRTGAAAFDNVSLTNLGDGICGCNFDDLA